MENPKLFFQVFPGFSCDEKLRELFSEVCIHRAVMVKTDKTLYLHMHSKKLIHKKYVYMMEDALKHFVFQNANMKVKMVEEYELSAQYTLSKLTNVYKESLLFELQKISSVLYRIIKNAEWFFDEDIITLTLDDTFLAKERASEIKKFLEDKYANVFHLSIKVGFDFTKEQKDTIKRANAYKLAQEVGEIVEAIAGEEKSEEEEADLEISENLKQVQPKKEKKSITGAYSKSVKGANDPDVIYGRNIDGDTIDILELAEGIGISVIRGKIIQVEIRELRNEKTLVIFAITDFTDTIMGKLFIPNEDISVFMPLFEKGKFYKIKGTPVMDTWSKEICFMSIMGVKPIPDFTSVRMDYAMDKRVELHMHTCMSDMDSVVDIKSIIKRAKAWGHPAIAITDHGVAQAFPIAHHVLEKDDPFKVIYGLEGYFVDDLRDLVWNSKNQSLGDGFVVFDIETTGLSPKHNKIIEIGAVKIVNGSITDSYSQFVNPEVPIPYFIEKLTGIQDEMVLSSPTIETVLPKFLEFVGDYVLVAHNASFDMGFIKAFAARMGLSCNQTVVDTMTMAHILLPELGKFTLDRICKELHIKLDNHHRALDDAAATARVFLKFREMLGKKGIENLDDFNAFGNVSKEAIKKARRYHGIILAKNEIGRIHLYRLISDAHIEYFHKLPLIPKSLIQKYREGLILGSACASGELFSAILNGVEDEVIQRLVEFYDYLEIQPLGNNHFMMEEERYSNIQNEEDLIKINRRIVKLGEEFQKPVVATCDVHFLDPEDSIYRAILMNSKGYKNPENQSPLYFRTTEEMLAEFEYLGSEKAREVVIDNTIKISDMIEKISPISSLKCPPVIENSDEMLREICYQKAQECYGLELPSLVSERLEKELGSIISNGYAVMYMIAQKLVEDSNQHGYVVGSRGSVGSSLVATMSGVTEVNPLSAHYICPKCHYTDFDSETIKNHSGNSGCDLPDAKCPQCGADFKKEGHDIPFETFLGFYGDKEPDIDLNFSGEYQAAAHAYTEELFGKGHAFRAGTIGTVAEKTAYAYVNTFYEERSIEKRRSEKERIAAGCTGVKRTTGQHPGGMVVLPKDKEIYEFTPIQKPANDMHTNVITTHFEYHSIDQNLLKLDILGHDDPTMMKRLEDLTGVDSQNISLDDQEVMRLFHSTDVLKIKPEDIGGTPIGSLGIPEFGTDFVIQMLVDTKPKNFSDLVRISGLSHGTDVWLGNAQTLISEGKTELSGAICCRDDIMIYLMHMGLEAGMAFNIMESVRRGRGLQAEWEEEMQKKGVPDWYLESCKKIKYMFPKAHAVAYVTMAWRIAWFKVNYPPAYYTAYFSIRAVAFSYEMMALGKDKLEYHMKEISKLEKHEQTNKDQDTMKDMRLVQEMYARGIEFLPIDLYVADDMNFQMIDGKIMPALCTIDGLGEKAAAQLKEAAKEGKFLSKEEVRTKAKINKTAIEKMTELGIISDLPNDNQLTFDFMM